MKEKKKKIIKHKTLNILICSILGMYLFGGKFCKFMDEELGERECTCPEIVSKHPQCECDRKHFNNFLWATVTVFQVSEYCVYLLKQQNTSHTTPSTLPS